jgi:heavy metal sensor kinase
VTAPRLRPRPGLDALCTVRVRLTLWYVALLAVILVGFSAFLYASLSRSLRGELDRWLAERELHIADNLDMRNGRIDLGDAAGELGADAVVAAYNPAGAQVIGGGTARSRASLGPTLAALSRGESGYLTLEADGEEWRVLTAPWTERGVRLGVIQVARSAHDLHGALRQLVLLMLLAIPLTLLVAVAGGLFLAGRTLDPIDRITRAAARIGAEDLSRRLGLRGRDELGRLAATFDAMLDRLERAFQRQRQFTADASHELRTPLALMTSQIEVALGRPRPAAEYRRVLESVHQDARRMSQLVAQLLTLARADAGEEILVREPLDLADLAVDLVAAMEPLADARGVRLRTGSVVSALVAGDQTRLTQLLVNLVDNAVKYTPSGGQVVVSAAPEPDTAVVRVEDTGVGIAPEHLPHIFERFYRTDKARGREDGAAGLGLAISQWIVHAHGGDIAVASEPGRGTTVTVRLPLAVVGAGHAVPPAAASALAAPTAASAEAR